MLMFSNNQNYPQAFANEMKEELLDLFSFNPSLQKKGLGSFFTCCSSCSENLLLLLSIWLRLIWYFFKVRKSS